MTGKTLVVAGGDGKIRFIDMATGEVQRTLTGHTNMIYKQPLARTRIFGGEALGHFYLARSPESVDEPNGGCFSPLKFNRLQQ